MERISVEWASGVEEWARRRGSVGFRSVRLSGSFPLFPFLHPLLMVWFVDPSRTGFRPSGYYSHPSTSDPDDTRFDLSIKLAKGRHSVQYSRDRRRWQHRQLCRSSFCSHLNPHPNPLRSSLFLFLFYLLKRRKLSFPSATSHSPGPRSEGASPYFGNRPVYRRLVKRFRSPDR